MVVNTNQRNVIGNNVVIILESMVQNLLNYDIQGRINSHNTNRESSVQTHSYVTVDMVYFKLFHGYLNLVDLIFIVDFSMKDVVVVHNIEVSKSAKVLVNLFATNIVIAVPQAVVEVIQIVQVKFVTDLYNNSIAVHYVVNLVYK